VCKAHPEVQEWIEAAVQGGEVELIPELKADEDMSDEEKEEYFDYPEEPPVPSASENSSLNDAEENEPWTRVCI
jgi:hypothetical protein